mmetsp:Transcript_7813/g.7278  ORF Transcript_7813/g.7278 Transcript_7813/m.7278 type:complete len:245 (+) Transcript_7813:1383-2117(+)
MISENEREFLEMTELIDMDRTLFENAMEKFDETGFDSLTFCQILTGNSLQYISFKLFDIYFFFPSFHIHMEKLANLARELQNGYFGDNPYHNVTHIVDSMQAMHYLISVGNLKKYLKKQDMLSAFIACLVHDYEHPGYSNQFVIRTKHPLAIRYSDISVLENHHLAAAFNIMFLKGDENNILENVTLDTYYEIRKMVIQIVLNTDFSKHFTLVTELKTKLGNNFPTDSSEDRILILSLALRVAD